MVVVVAVFLVLVGNTVLLIRTGEKALTKAVAVLAARMERPKRTLGATLDKVVVAVATLPSAIAEPAALAGCQMGMAARAATAMLPLLRRRRLAQRPAVVAGETRRTPSAVRARAVTATP